MIVSVVPLADNSRKFVYADIGECNTLVNAGFGAFGRRCYDMSLRQQITFSLSTLISNSFVEYWTNTTPLISLILALNHLVRQIAISYGDHSNIYADRDVRQLLLPKRVAMTISAFSHRLQSKRERACGQLLGRQAAELLRKRCLEN